MKNKFFFLAFLLFTVFSFKLYAQAGELDTTFRSLASGANGHVQTISVQSDGKIIIAGDFTNYKGVAINRVARLNTDGILDTTFNPGTGANNTVATSSIQSDGKIIIGGYFTTYNTTARKRIARLNTDGTLDSTFNPGTGADGFVGTNSIQSDEKIIIGGGFGSYNGVSCEYIARLNTDGSLDTTFNSGTGAENRVFTTAIQSDGKIIIGGWFISYNGTSRNYIARLNANGSLDTTFNPGIGASYIVYTNSIQNDGKIIIAGDFTSYNGTARNRIARLNTDGSLDSSFNPGTGFDLVVSTSAIQSDGKIILGGNFDTYNGTAIHNSIVRLNTNGTIDGTFDLGTGINYGYINTTAIQSDGKILIGSNFSFTYNGLLIHSVARLKMDISTSISQTFVDDMINIYPNPSNGQFTLKGNNITSIEVYNVRGEKVFQSTIHNPQSEIDLSTQANGIYFMKIYDGLIVHTKKIVIQ